MKLDLFEVYDRIVSIYADSLYRHGLQCDLRAIYLRTDSVVDLMTMSGGELSDIASNLWAFSSFFRNARIAEIELSMEED